jgi:hypothetical protein
VVGLAVSAVPSVVPAVDDVVDDMVVDDMVVHHGVVVGVAATRKSQECRHQDRPRGRQTESLNHHVFPL